MAETIIPRHILSKSTFMRGCQCTKNLWLYKHRYDLMDEATDSKQLTFRRGTEVGVIARDLFPGGVDASPVDAFHYQQSVALTSKLIASGKKIIYEAAFQYDGVLAAIDILVKKGNKWYGFEVKSSTSVKKQYIQDAALQYLVITKSGLQLEDIFIVHLNNKYVRKGKLDVENLFHKESVLDEVLELQLSTLIKCDELKEVAALTRMPRVKTGDHCNKPYVCDFYNYCWKDFEEETNSEKAVTLKKELKGFISELEYPLHFLDFETYSVPVPEFDGHWPYRQIPFQYSLHIKQDRKSEIKHFHFLSECGINPCASFIERLIGDLGKTGSIIVYNRNFENTRLNELKDEFPKYSKAIEKIQERFVDLMVPFRKKFLYLPQMNGSYSIKNVLPALVPDLTYDSLLIGNGMDASQAFYDLKFEKNTENIVKVREALLEYCKLDTWAMVKILEKVKSCV